jgi:hypothetical protein
VAVEKKIEATQCGILETIDGLVGNHTLGNPENPLRWTTKSLRNIAKQLNGQGFEISYHTVQRILRGLGYSLQVNKKFLPKDTPHPDSFEQIDFIGARSIEFISRHEPVISVDTKKKENIGNFKNNGAEYNKSGNPTLVLDHDFPIKELGKVSPYGVYDVSENIGFVNLGRSHDTAEFAIESINRWWNAEGYARYPNATKMLITCDGGGSNSSRSRLWKTELQALVNKISVDISVSHFPPGASKWNKIEHRLFCYISKNWRGRPLTSVDEVMKLIKSTTTEQGLKVRCMLDENTYEIGKTVSDELLANVNIYREPFHGEWNYTIKKQS